MRNITDALKTTFQVASSYIQLLPATGGAQEELTNVDDTEWDDTR